MKEEETEKNLKTILFLQPEPLSSNQGHSSTISPIKGNETLKTVPSLHHPSKQQQQLISPFKAKTVKIKVTLK